MMMHYDVNGTKRKEVNLHEKVNQEYRIQCFHMTLRFRENWL